MTIYRRVLSDKLLTTIIAFEEIFTAVNEESLILPNMTRSVSSSNAISQGFSTNMKTCRI